MHAASMLACGSRDTPATSASGMWMSGMVAARRRASGRVPGAGQRRRPEVTVDFVEVNDDLVGPLGAKGVGEIGQVGAAAAVANAVFHATGRRIRSLPMAELVMDPAGAGLP